jgi:hypothetical protein
MALGEPQYGSPMKQAGAPLGFTEADVAGLKANMWRLACRVKPEPTKNTGITIIVINNSGKQLPEEFQAHLKIMETIAA